MKLDDLKQDFQQAIETDSDPEKISELVDKLAAETSKIDKEIKRRDMLEIGVALLLIPAWIYRLTDSASTLQTIGLLFAIATCLFIPYKLVSAKKVEAKISDSHKDFLHQEKQKVSQQKAMLESVLWWYVGPIALSVLMITLGKSVDENGIPQILPEFYWYYAFLAVFSVGLVFLNKKNAKKKFDPILEKINQHLNEIS